MDANQNPPSEREWTPEEQEEFLSKLGDNVFSGTPINNAPFIPNAIAAPITLQSLQEMKAQIDSLLPKSTGIHITSIVPPESGWPIIAHCDICRKTVIVLSPWAVKPSDGDYFRMNGTCLDEELGMKHNMYPQTFYPWKA